MSILTLTFSIIHICAAWDTTSRQTGKKYKKYLSVFVLRQKIDQRIPSRHRTITRLPPGANALHTRGEDPKALVRGTSTRGIKCEACREAAGRRGNEGDHGRDLLQRASALHWDFVGHVLDLLQVWRVGSLKCCDHTICAFTCSAGILATISVLTTACWIFNREVNRDSTNNERQRVREELSCISGPAQ